MLKVVRKPRQTIHQFSPFSVSLLVKLIDLYNKEVSTLKRQDKPVSLENECRGS